MLLLFLLLQVMAISMLVNYSRSHRARYMQLAYETTGRINKQYTALTRYFSLGETNRGLAAENEMLYNLLPDNYTTIDTGISAPPAGVSTDTTKQIRKYNWRAARVVGNSVSLPNNYITLERGALQGIQPDMAVVSPTGIVGVVTDVSNNMCVVMSLLHRKSNTSVALKKGGTSGILEWNGENPGLLQLRGIPKSAELDLGDTIVTSRFSLNYPPGLLVGTIAGFELDEGAAYYNIQVLPGANFYTLDHVYIIENLFIKEQQELEKRAQR